MSMRSSSGSWSGTGGAPPDIIDLDKFMRGAVRPTRADAHVLRCGDKLVVDAGGVDRKPAALGPSAAAPAAAATPPGPEPLSAPVALSPLTAPSESSGSRSRPHGPHGKRYSHDSGLSDTSYARRKCRPHRRAVGGDNTSMRNPRTPAANSRHSLRAFRAVCERALLDQQAQIARVAQLCERLSERPPPPPPPPQSLPLRRRSDRSVTDTSDVSSSSRSTRDQRRKDKHRTDECKTYKIIMNKLDELNRLFATRARAPKPAPHAPTARPAPHRHTPSSSGSVSVSDKVVSTEPSGAERTREQHIGAERTREQHVANNVVTIRGGSTYGACASCSASAARGAGGGGGSRRLPPACAQDALPRPVVVTERCTHGKNSVALCESRAGTGTSSGDPRCGFDLDDPVHLYSQAKRLQAMSATTRRARSMDPLAQRFQRFQRFEHDEHSQRSHRSGRAEGREHSLCSLCRGYWRSLTHYLAAQIFCCPDDAAVR